MDLSLLAADADSGGVVDWLAAVGSIAAAAVPAMLFLFERRDRQEADRRRDVAERERNEAEERFRQAEIDRATQAQAALFHVWVDEQEQ